MYNKFRTIKYLVRSRTACNLRLCLATRWSYWTTKIGLAGQVGHIYVSSHEWRQNYIIY